MNASEHADAERARLHDPSGTGREAAATPALSCPSWCETDHAGRASGGSHQGARRTDGDIEVALYMTDYGTRAPELAGLNGAVDIFVTWTADGLHHNRNASRPLAEAEGFAREAEAFGRPGVAALIRELAALAKRRAGGEGDDDLTE